MSSITIRLASVIHLPQIGQNTVSTFCSDQPDSQCHFVRKGQCHSNLVISMGNMMIHQGIFGVLCLQTNPCTFFLCIWVICSVHWHDAWKYYIGPKNKSKISAAQMVLARSCENCDKLLQTMGTQQNYHLHFWMEYTIYRSVCAWVSHFESLRCRSPNQPGVQAAGAQSPPGSALPRYHRKVPSNLEARLPLTQLHESMHQK